MSRIERLTPEQEERLRPWAEKWIAIGLSTERADHERVEAAYRVLYRAIDVPFPEGRVVRVSSPLVGALEASMSERLLSGSAVYVAVDGAVGEAVYDAVDGAVYDAVGVAVRGAVGDAVYGAVGEAVGDAVYGAVGVAVRDAVLSKALACHYWIGGSLWSAYPAYYSYVRDVLGVTLPDIAQHYEALSLHGGYSWPNSRFLILCDRPMLIERDERGRLHSDSGPSIAWRDGYSLHSWHGITVPERVIMDPESLTLDDIRQEGNAERRRVMIERIGLETLLRRSEHTVLDKCGDDAPIFGLRGGRLIRIEMPYEPVVVVDVANSTPEPDGTRRRYLMGVHPECRPLLGDGRYGGPQELSVRNAVASLYGLRGDEYAPVHEA